MVIRDDSVGGHRYAAVAAAKSSAYRSIGSKSTVTAETRSTKLVLVTQTGLRKPRNNGGRTTKSILKKKGGGLLRRNKKGPKITHSVTFKDGDASTGRNGDNSTIASESSYSSAKICSMSGSATSRLLDPTEEGGETQEERDPPELDQQSPGGDAFFSLGPLPTLKRWPLPDLSLPSFRAATNNMNSWIMAQAGVEADHDMNSPTSSASPAMTTNMTSVPSSTSSDGLSSEYEAEPVPGTPNIPPLGKPPLHPSSTPSRCPPSPTGSFVIPAEPKYGDFQDASSLQESIEVSEATPKAGNAINYYHSNTGISISSSGGASDATPRIGSTLVIEVPSIIISNGNDSEGEKIEELESNSASFPPSGGSSTGSILPDTSNRNNQGADPFTESEPLEQNQVEAHLDENSPLTVENSPSSTQTSEASTPSSPSTTESVKVEMDGEAQALSKDGTNFPSPSLPNASGTLKIASPRYTMELIEEMDKPSRPNHHKRSISLPKYFDKFRQYDSLVAAEVKAESKSTMRADTSSTSVQEGASEMAAVILKEAKGTTFEPVVNVHVHLNSNDVRAVASGTNDESLAATEANIPSKTEVAESPVDKAGSEEQDMNALVGDGVSRAGLDEMGQPLEHKPKVSEVAEIVIKESLDMDMDELALLSTTQYIMECRDPLSPKNPHPMIKKHRREPRKSPSCSTILSKKAARCILHCAESHVFTNLFSCANEDDALVDIESALDGNNESSVQERSRRLKTSKHKKEKKRRPSRETEAEQTPVVFDSGGVSFCLGVGNPGSDLDNDEICRGDDRKEHGNGSRDSSWEQDTIVMRRHDSSSIDSEAEDDENQVRRKSKEKQQHRHRHRHHHSEKSRSSSSHPSRRSGSRSRSNRDSSRSRSKSSTRTSSSRSRSRSKSGKSPSKSRRGFGCKKEDSSMFSSSKGKHQCPSPSKSRR